jgi:outer membrane protein assembly factor BamB
MKNSNLLKLVVLFLSVFLVACGSTKKKELKPVKLASFDKQVKVKTLWSKKAGSGQGKFYHQFNLAMDKDYLYTASEKGKVYKFDKKKGKKQWKVSLEEDLTAGVEVDGEHVYMATSSGSILALDKETGEQSWAVELDGEVVSTPTVIDDHLLVLTVDGAILSLNAKTGDSKWRYDTTMPALSLRGNSRSAGFSDFVLAGATNGKVVVLDAETGQLRWDPKVADASGDTDLERVVDVDSTPLVINETLYAVSFQGRIVAYNLTNGRAVWASDESSYKDLKAGFGNIYVTSDNSQLTAYDQQNGNIKWVQEGLLRRKLSAPATVGSYVAVADYKGYLHLLSQEDGEFAARKRIALDQSVRASILVDGSRFYTLADNGSLKAYRLGEQVD